MFWRKPKSKLEVSQLHSLAQQLGVERRANVRVSYPLISTGPLPAISHNQMPLRVHDISRGGCCLLDIDFVLGTGAGHEVELDIHWSGHTTRVLARVVGSWDLRRHIQFNNLPQIEVQRLESLMAAGVRGLSMSQALMSEARPQITVEAREMWSSWNGDSLILRDEKFHIADVVYDQKPIKIFESSWPSHADGSPVSPKEMLDLTLFIANFPKRGPLLDELLLGLEQRTLKGQP